METQKANLVWRVRAKIIAVIDIVSGFIHIFLTIFVATLFDKLFPTHDASQEFVAVELWVFLTCIAIASIYSAMGMFAGIKLLRATKEGMNYYEASKNAKIWKNTTTLFLVVAIISYSCLHFFIPLAITIIWRVISFYIVVSFTKELEKVAAY